MTQPEPPATVAASASRQHAIVPGKLSPLKAAAAAGATLVLNQQPLHRPVLHLITCGNIENIDLPPGRPGRHHLLAVGGPEILAGVRCRPCGGCHPDMRGYTEPPIWQRPVRGRNLRAIHVGRTVTLSDGRILGAIVSVAIVHTADGTGVTIHTTTGDHNLDPDAHVSAQLPVPGTEDGSPC